MIQVTPIHRMGLLQRMLLLLICQTALYAQILPFEHYSIKDGLPSNWITTIFQDSRGYLWVGGDGGMAVYDGVHFKSFSTDDGLPAGQVWHIQESRIAPGTMLIGTHGGGLSKLRDGKISSLLMGKVPASNIVFRICEARDGVIWCGTSWGVYRVQNDSASFFSTGTDSGHVPILREMRDGRILMSLGKGLYRYSPATQTTARVELNIAPTLLSCMIEDEDGTLWFGADSGAIYQVRDDRVIAARHTPQLGVVNGMIDDGTGNLWLATGAGLFKISKKNFVAGEMAHYTTAHGLPELNFHFGLRDRENNLWFSMRNRGLVKLSEPRVVTFPMLNLLPDVLNRAAVADTIGHLFVISGEGLWEIWKQPDAGWQRFLHRIPTIYRQDNQRALSQRLVSVDMARGGLLWLTVSSGGLFGYKITPRVNQASLLTRVQTLQPGVELPSGTPVGITIDRENQLWYDVWSGPLVQLQLGEMKRRPFPLLEGNTVRALCHDAEGNLWVGMFNGGISILARENGEYHLRRRLTKSDGLPSEQIRSLVHRRNGEIWIGTRFNGIAIYREGKFETLTRKDGLLNNAVWAMSEDEEGRMWIGTSVGLQHTAAENSRRLLTPQKLFGKHIGGIGMIPGTQTIWCVSSEELAIYEYGHQSAVHPQPLIYITGLRVNGKERPLQDGAEFSHAENSCRIEFTGLSFKDESALRYKYRLRGWDERWQETTSERAVNFASLRAGNYTFEVSAIAAEGIESAAPAAWRFKILPPFWLRWWFIAFCVLVIGSVAYAIHVARLDRLLAIEKIRSRIATDLHDDIGAGLTHIGLLSQVALQKAGVPQNGNGALATEETPSELGHAMARVGHIARELSAAMSDVVWSVNPQHDSMSALQRRLRTFAHEICEAKGIALHLEIAAPLTLMKLDPEVRRNLLLIAKEALHNAVKYSGSASISVKFAWHDKNIFMEIVDAGKGFALASAKSGNGLSNMRLRAEKLGGKLEILSEAGKGTRIQVHVPIKA